MVKEMNIYDIKNKANEVLRQPNQLFKVILYVGIIQALFSALSGLFDGILGSIISLILSILTVTLGHGIIVASLKVVNNIVASLSNVFSFVFILVIIISILSVYLSLKFGLFNYILQKYNYTGLTALKESSRLMKGNKWTLFKLEFSFFGWMILAGLVSGVVAMFVETIMPIPFLVTFITGVVSTFFSAYFYDVKLNTCLAVFYEELDYADKNSVEL